MEPEAFVRRNLPTEAAGLKEENSKIDPLFFEVF
jgi:hypothetical protein